jgi:hypothetical protein
MRHAVWVISVAVLATSGYAFGGEPGCLGCSKSIQYQGVWAAEACGAPAGYTMVPGCGEEHRPCCDNAWAGYCEHRAKVDAFWSRVGQPGSCGRGAFSRPVRCEMCSEGCSTVIVQPTPAVVTPSPTPAQKEKTSPTPAPPKVLVK